LYEYKKVIQLLLKNGDRPKKYRRWYDLKTVSNHESGLSDLASNGCMFLRVQLSKSFQTIIQKKEHQIILSSEIKTKNNNEKTNKIELKRKS
jgi:hypothetical protein